MTDNQPYTLENIDSKSSVFDKLDPDLRRRVNQALADRQPAAYRAVYDQFRLRDHGLSYTAFYYYARRVRINAALVELAQTALPGDAAVQDLLPQLLSHRLLEAATDENATPRALQRLADAYRVASQTCFAHRRLAAELGAARKKAVAKETDDLVDIMHQYLKLERAKLPPTPPSGKG